MNLLMAATIFFTGIASAFVGGVTSGGGGLISIPVFIFLGLPPDIAVATNRFGSLGYVASTIYRFSKAKKIVFKYVLPLAIISAAGGIIGANILMNIDRALLTRIIGAVILLLLPVIFWNKELGVKEKENNSRRVMISGFVLYFFLSIYDGFLGAGGGILVAYLFVFVFGLTFTKANATEKIPYIFNILLSIAIFAFHHLINYYYGLIYLAGALIGGYLGAHMAVKKGDRWVRAVFVIIAIIFGIKLIFFR